MKKKLFGQNIKPDCVYCENAVFSDNSTYCQKNRRIKNGKCRAFKYDPLMRVPKTSVLKTDYTADDFKL